MTTRIIYDCDPGNDDAVAILAAVSSPALDVRAVTTGAGHLDADRTARNAAITVAISGRSVPVCAGARGPLLRDRVVARFLDLESALDPDRPDLPAVAIETDHAAERIATTLRASAGTTVVCTGPLTNLALALRMHPDIVGRIGRVITLGGAWGLGTRTAAAEWNVFCDPEAAAIVYGSGVPITTIPVDASGIVPITVELVTRIEQLGGARAQFAAELLKSLRTTHKPGRFSTPDAPLHDPCAILVAIDPSLAETEPARIDVELSRGPTYGRTTIDFGGRSGLPINADVVVNFDVARTQEALVTALRRLDKD